MSGTGACWRREGLRQLSRNPAACPSEQECSPRTLSGIASSHRRGEAILNMLTVQENQKEKNIHNLRMGLSRSFTPHRPGDLQSLASLANRTKPARPGDGAEKTHAFI